jgi:maltose alpha-D-glucosyltransferase/alpha-amylase
VAGWLAYRSARDDPAALGILQEFVPNEGDVWEYTLDEVSAYYERAASAKAPAPVAAGTSTAEVLEASRQPPPLAAEMVGSYLDMARLLGRRTAELHRALATAGEDPAFKPEPFTALYQRSVFQTMRNQATGTFALLRKRMNELAPDVRARAATAAGLTDGALALVSKLTRGRVSAVRIRTHGDLHCGQVLWTGRDVVFIDFEGEPGRPLAERRHKRSALSDVAGMLRSFHYAAFGTLLNPRVGGAIRSEDVANLEPWATFWYLSVAGAFLRAYLEEAASQPFIPTDPAQLAALLELSTLQKVLYELDYELNNRPDWVSIPLRGLLELMGSREAPASP